MATALRDAASGRPAGRRRATVLVALALAAITIAGAGLRVHRADTAQGKPSADERAYLRLARDLQQGGTWGDSGLKQPFRWSPGAPGMFAAAGALSGRPVDRDTAFTAQIVVGTLVVPATFALAAVLAGWVPGLLAAAAVAAYPALIRSTALAGTEPLGALLIALSALALAVAWRRRGPGAFAVAGAVLGLATLARGDLVLAAVGLPVIVAAALGRAAGARRGLACGLAMLAGALALLVPWSAFATAHAHRFVPVTDGGASNLFVGTYLPADGRLFGVKGAFAADARRVHPTLRHTKTSKLPQQLVLDAVAARYPQLSRDRALRRAAMDNLRRYALGHPLAFAGMEARKLWRMWGRPYGGSLHHPARGDIWLHRALVALALAGLAAGLLRTRDARLALLVALLGLVTVVDVALISEPRHNARLLPVLLAAGAAGAWMAVGAGRFSLRRS